MRVRVVHVVHGWDMRQKHILREGRWARALKPGQCLLAFNRRLDMARLIDCEGGVHDWYADQGEEFDLEGVAARMQRAFYVEMDVGQHERVRLRVAA